jgi:ubiquinone/menaquinone biosynthesis C-methylase UbiE
LHPQTKVEPPGIEFDSGNNCKPVLGDGWVEAWDNRSSMTFDAEHYKANTQQQWDKVAAGWNRWTDTLDSWFGPATEAMLDRMGVKPGERVLDVAAGTGEQTIQVARRVGKSGHVLATDLSAGMLELAASNVARAGLTNVETLAVDAEKLEVEEGSFDAVLSRHGIIFVPNKAECLRRIALGLRAGGRVGLMGYTSPQANDFFRVPVSIIRRRAGLAPPKPGAPGLFSFSNGAIETLLDDAGFSDIDAKAVPAPLSLHDAQELLAFEKQAFGALHEMMSGLSPRDQESVWEEIGEAFKAYESSSGLSCPCELLVVVAKK